MPATVEYEKRSGAAHVRLNRPEALNAFNHKSLEDLRAAWEDFNADDDLWVALLRGKGRSFSAGADVKAGRIGASARYLILIGDTIDPEQAQRQGFVHEGVPRDHLLERADQLAERVLRNSPPAPRYAKEARIRGMEMGFHEAVAYARHMEHKLSQTEDMQEGLRAFLEKPQPVWKGQ